MAEELTPEQKKEKRNEYARAYYAKNKEKMKNNAAAKKDGKSGVDKKTEKFAVKGAKTVAAAKDILAGAANILGEAYKTCDAKIIDRTEKLFHKQLGLTASRDVDDGTVNLSFDVGTKKIRLPREFVKQARASSELAEQDIEDTPEIAVDPDVAAALADGADLADVVDEDPEIEQDEDILDEDDEDDEDDEYSEDEDDDRMYGGEDDYRRGAGEMMREMEAQGWGEEN